MAVLDELKQLEQQVVDRLQQLEPLVGEYQELRRVAERLGVSYEPSAQPATRSSRRRPARATTTRRRTRAARATPTPGSTSTSGSGREADVLRLVAQQPGITVTGLGKELGVDPTGLYRVVRKLTANGQVVKEGAQLQPASTAAAGT